MEDNVRILSNGWLKKMEERAKKSRLDHGNPETTELNHYPAAKINGTWWLCNNGVWWLNPVIVREYHEYAEGMVVEKTYVENVQRLPRNKIVNRGLRPIHTSELAKTFGIHKVIHYDYSSLDSRGHPTKTVRILREVPDEEAN